MLRTGQMILAEALLRHYLGSGSYFEIMKTSFFLKKKRKENNQIHQL